jgi:hypothetical protein
MRPTLQNIAPVGVSCEVDMTKKARVSRPPPHIAGPAESPQRGAAPRPSGPSACAGARPGTSAPAGTPAQSKASREAFANRVK